MACIAATTRGASSHVLKGEQPILPTCFSFANGNSFSASPNADLGVNSVAFSYPGTTNQMVQPRGFSLFSSLL